MTILVKPNEVRGATLDEAHVGHIHGAFGTILHGDVGPRETWKHRLITLMAILGPGLIVMVGDNDAGSFATYGQAGQNYGTTLLWTLALLIPVLYVNQEMVLRLGAVTGVGHARLIFERFGKFWGAFSVIDLFLLNSLTIITEFIGIALALDYLGLDKTMGVIVSAALIMIAVSTGNFRRFERFAMALVFASLLLIPTYFMVHPPRPQSSGCRRPRRRDRLRAAMVPASRRIANQYARRPRGGDVYSVRPSRGRHGQRGARWRASRVWHRFPRCRRDFQGGPEHPRPQHGRDPLVLRGGRTPRWHGLH